MVCHQLTKPSYKIALWTYKTLGEIYKFINFLGNLHYFLFKSTLMATQPFQRSRDVATPQRENKKKREVVK